MDESYKLTTFLVLILVVLLMIMSRAYLGSASEYHRALRAERVGDTTAAIAHYGRSIRWYAPMSPWGKRSLAALWEIGQDRWEKGDSSTAELAVITLRSSLYSARGPFTPFRVWIKRADGWLATHVPEKHPEITEAELDRVLAAERPPDRFWSFLVGIGFVGWIIAVFGLIFTVFPSSGEKISVRRAVVIGALVVVCYGLWITGLYFA
jgi:hypothetical protein